jgi:hypothetical protein
MSKPTIFLHYLLILILFCVPRVFAENTNDLQGVLPASDQVENLEGFSYCDDAQDIFKEFDLKAAQSAITELEGQLLDLERLLATRYRPASKKRTSPLIAPVELRHSERPNDRTYADFQISPELYEQLLRVGLSADDQRLFGFITHRVDSEASIETQEREVVTAAILLKAATIGALTSASKYYVDSRLGKVEPTCMGWSKSIYTGAVLGVSFKALAGMKAASLLSSTLFDSACEIVADGISHYFDLSPSLTFATLCGPDTFLISKAMTFISDAVWAASPTIRSSARGICFTLDSETVRFGNLSSIRAWAQDELLPEVMDEAGFALRDVQADLDAFLDQNEAGSEDVLQASAQFYIESLDSDLDLPILLSNQTVLAEIDLQVNQYGTYEIGLYVDNDQSTPILLEEWSFSASEPYESDARQIIIDVSEIFGALGASDGQHGFFLQVENLTSGQTEFASSYKNEAEIWHYDIRQMKPPSVELLCASLLVDVTKCDFFVVNPDDTRPDTLSLYQDSNVIDVFGLLNEDDIPQYGWASGHRLTTNLDFSEGIYDLQACVANSAFTKCSKTMERFRVTTLPRLEWDITPGDGEVDQPQAYRIRWRDGLGGIGDQRIHLRTSSTGYFTDSGGEPIRAIDTTATGWANFTYIGTQVGVHTIEAITVPNRGSGREDSLLAEIAITDDNGTSPEPGDFTVVADPNPITLNESSTITASIPDAPTDTLVTFETSFPGVFSPGWQDTVTVASDESGKANVEFYPDVSGTASILASTSNYGQAIVELDVLHPAGDVELGLTIYSHSRVEGATQEYTAIATVLNDEGQPVEGFPHVYFSTSRGTPTSGSSQASSTGTAYWDFTVEESGFTTVTAEISNSSRSITFFAHTGSINSIELHPARSLSFSSNVRGLQYTQDGSILIALPERNGHNLYAWSTSDYLRIWSQEAAGRMGGLNISPNDQYLIFGDRFGYDVRRVSDGERICRRDNPDGWGVLAAWTSHDGSSHLHTSREVIYRSTSRCGSSQTASAQPRFFENEWNGFDYEYHMAQRADATQTAVLTRQAELIVMNSVGQEIHRNVGRMDHGYVANYSQSGNRLVTGGDQTLKLWNTETWVDQAVVPRTLQGRHYSAVFIDNDSKLAIAGHGKFEIIDLESRETLFHGDLPTRAFAAAWNPHTEELAFGTDNNEVLIFKPLEPLAPLVSTLTSSNVKKDQAVLNAEANPMGSTSWARFEYGQDGQYSSVTTAISIGDGADWKSVNEVVSGLACETSYSYRAIAENLHGHHVEGSVSTFVTSACPDCEFSLTPQAINAAAEDGKVSVIVSAHPACAWGIGGLPSWISLLSSETSQGEDVVELYISENLSGSPRTAELQIGEALLSVIQLPKDNVFHDDFSAFIPPDSCQSYPPPDDLTRDLYLAPGYPDKPVESLSDLIGTNDIFTFTDQEGFFDIVLDEDKFGAIEFTSGPSYGEVGLYLAGMSGLDEFIVSGAISLCPGDFEGVADQGNCEFKGIHIDQLVVSNASNDALVDCVLEPDLTYYLNFRFLDIADCYHLSEGYCRFEVMLVEPIN